MTTTAPKTTRGPNTPRTYVARPKPGVDLPTRMVETTHPSIALRHVAESLYTVETIGVKEAIALAKTVEVEVPGAPADDAAEG